MPHQSWSRRAQYSGARIAFAALIFGALVVGAAGSASAQHPLVAAAFGVTPADSGSTAVDVGELVPLPRGSHAVLQAARTVAWESPVAGATVAGIALSYVGYPYVYAGNSPAYGFDCSGFTQFVVLAAFGIDIGHGVAGQPFMAGYPVAWGAWQPGDLVYFQNTYTEGISHAAIYIGDGLIVHAENEGSGVTIDSVYSEYYAGHYWGAVRIG